VSQEMNDPASWRMMYDSADPSAIPDSAPMVAGYVRPSRYAWSSGDFARFAGRPHVHITVAGAEPDAALASVVDVDDPGGFSPAQARRFIREREAFRPGSASVYVDKNRLDEVTAACEGLTYWLWLAWWLGRPPTAAEVAELEASLPQGVRLAAWQHTTTPGYDISSVIDPRWHSK